MANVLVSGSDLLEALSRMKIYIDAKPVTGSYMQFTTSVAGLGTALLKAGDSLDVTYTGNCDGKFSRYLGIALTDGNKDTYIIPFTRYVNGGTDAVCDSFAYGGGLWTVRHNYGSTKGQLTFTRFA